MCRVVFSPNTISLYESHLLEKASTALHYRCTWTCALRKIGFATYVQKCGAVVYGAGRCHCIHGYDIMPNAYKSTLQQLLDVQRSNLIPS